MDNPQSTYVLYIININKERHISRIIFMQTKSYTWMTCYILMTYMYMYVCVCLYVCKYIHTYIYMYVCMYVYTYIHMCVCVCVCVHTHTHTHTYIVYFWSKSIYFFKSFGIMLANYLRRKAAVRFTAMKIETGISL